MTRVRVTPYNNVKRAPQLRGQQWFITLKGSAELLIGVGRRSYKPMVRYKSFRVSSCQLEALKTVLELSNGRRSDMQNRNSR